MLNVHGSTKLLILVFIFLKYVILWVHPWCDLLWYKFFNFSNIVWLVKSSWYVHCCSNHQLYWVSDCCWSEFALWWFFVRKNVVTVLAVFLSFWSLLPDITWVFINLKERADFLWSIMYCLLVNSTWECLLFDFSFFPVESWLLMCLTVMRFFSLQVFPFLITVSGWYYHFDVLIFINFFNSTGAVVFAPVNMRW